MRWKVRSRGSSRRRVENHDHGGKNFSQGGPAGLIISQGTRMMKKTSKGVTVAIVMCRGVWCDSIGVCSKPKCQDLSNAASFAWHLVDKIGHYYSVCSWNGFQPTLTSIKICPSHLAFSKKAAMSTGLIHRSFTQRFAQCCASSSLLTTPVLAVLIPCLPASRYPHQQPLHTIPLQRHQWETHCRDPQTIPPTIQKGRRDAPPRSRPAPAWLYKHQCHERGGTPVGNASDARLRGCHLLYHVQPGAGGEVPPPSLHNSMTLPPTPALHTPRPGITPESERMKIPASQINKEE